jgi:hypothetical protein
MRRGSLIVYRIRRGTTVMDVPMRFESPLRSVYIVVRQVAGVVVALIFVAIALLILRARRGSRAMVFYALTTLSACAILLSGAMVYEQANGRGIIVSPLPALRTIYVGAVLTFTYPPLILHLCLVFPHRRPILDRHPKLLHWIYAVAAVGVLAMLGMVVLLSLLDWSNVAGSHQRLKPILRPVYYALVTFSVLVGLNILWAGRREGERNAVGARPFRIAGAIGVLPIVLVPAISMLISERVAGAFSMLAVGGPMFMLGTFPLFAFAALILSYREANAEEKRQVA